MMNRLLIIIGIVALILVTIVYNPPAPASLALEPSTQARTSVFKVVSSSEDRRGGTGFLLTTESNGNIIVTNRHVCEVDGDTNNRLTLLQGDKRFSVSIKQKSDLHDICILNAPSELNEVVGLKLAARDAVSGQTLTVEGHPWLKPLTKFMGPFVNFTVEPLDIYEISPKKFIRIGRLNFPVFPGNSGSPITNSEGQVVGVVFAMEGYSKNGLYVPLLDLKYFLMQAGG